MQGSRREDPHQRRAPHSNTPCRTASVIETMHRGTKTAEAAAGKIPGGQKNANSGLSRPLAGSGMAVKGR